MGLTAAPDPAADANLAAIARIVQASHCERMAVMNVAPLCIIQARLHSTRLPGKMLRTLGGETLVARGLRIASEAFAPYNVVVAIPATDEAGPLDDELRRLGATVFSFAGDENDVLGRFHACAHQYRWHPDSVIVRYTPDDPFKNPGSLRRVARGERLPVELGGEAFTLAMLDEADDREVHQFDAVAMSEIGTLYNVQGGGGSNPAREHITSALFPTAPPPPPPGVWTIDTEDDLREAERAIAVGERS